MNDRPEPDVDGLATELAGRDDRVVGQRLHDRLVARAEEEGILDVVYRVVAAPVGPLLVAATHQGVVTVAFEHGDPGHARALRGLAERVSPRILEAPDRLEGPVRQLDEYFEGERRSFDVPLDLRLSRGFRRNALAEIARIPYGRTRSYTQVAAASGSPRAVRAVGTACATNPLPIFVPCHRVLRADGSPGGYGGGLEAKRWLLALETT